MVLSLFLFPGIRPGITLKALGRKWRDSCKEWNQPTRITDHQVNGQWKAISMCRRNVSKTDVPFNSIWKAQQQMQGWEDGLVSRTTQQLCVWMSADFCYGCFPNDLEVQKKSKCLTFQKALRVATVRWNVIKTPVSNSTPAPWVLVDRSLLLATPVADW